MDFFAWAADFGSAEAFEGAAGLAREAGLARAGDLSCAAGPFDADRASTFRMYSIASGVLQPVSP